MDEIEQEFSELMAAVYLQARTEAKYNATIFARMLAERGALETARYLLREPQVSSGFVALWERGRLDLTVEAQVLANSKFWSLFEQRDLDTARRWLKEYGYESETGQS